ncbi:MAG: sensor histidine kinase [Cellulophaga sp.]
MKPLLNKYTAIAIGFFIVLSIIIVLHQLGLIIVPDFKSEYAEVSVIFIFWWSLSSFFIYRFPYLLKNKRALYTIGILLIIITVLITVEYNNTTPDHPISITLMMLFWLVCIYLIAPEFSMKYRKLILSVYAVLILVFLYSRLFTSYDQELKFDVLSAWMLTFPAIIALWAFEQWKWLKNLKKGKADAELQLLKNQINPHFFFNTLNNLYGLTVEKSDDAPKVVLKLSEMMRYTIYEGKEDYVSLKDEVTYLENFIELHKIRYHQHVDISFNYTLNDEYKVAPLLYIILLENAFKHGVECLTQDAYIYINLKAEKGIIYFEIENNLEYKDTVFKGIGLNNLKERLRLIYPKKHFLTIDEKELIYKARLEIDTK